MIRKFDDDEWFELMSNGQCFAGEGLQIGIGGQLPYVQLFNPAGSGVRIRLRNLATMPVFSVSINANVTRHDVAIGVLGAFAGPTNLLGDGPLPVAEIRTLSQVGSIGSAFWLILSAGNTRKNYPALNLDWGHDLLPGQGIMMRDGAGGLLLVGFMWAEVPE